MVICNIEEGSGKIKKIRQNRWVIMLVFSLTLLLIVCHEVHSAELNVFLCVKESLTRQFFKGFKWGIFALDFRS